MWKVLAKSRASESTKTSGLWKSDIKEGGTATDNCWGSRRNQYAAANPECASYVMCELNAIEPRDTSGLPTFKSGLTKLSSFAAAWFLSSETNNSFFTLYAAANMPTNCQKKYPVDCSDFHAGEERVTTEYFHNEL
ncbi:uncharacterized protein LOC113375248 [Ctenocephalides felis]|uniref:uncharacterized protein LOC113375248 n=1 Tax=Ctenocephalides felis TaxID=7515 RepID=UPI000E6E35A8|nr:uncharacterized protein LOC113375248 [Ctenocephalides felis]